MGGASCDPETWRGKGYVDESSNTFETFSRMAERLVDQAHHYTYGDGGDPVRGAALAAEAQVYATLALAEATRLAGQGGDE